MLENGQILAARFALLRRLGAGRWGEVWLAHERDGGRDFALKVLTPALAGQPDLRARFLAAARLQRELADPAVLRCEEIVDSDPCFAVLAYAPGGSLSTWRGRAVEPLIRESLLRLMPNDECPETEAIGGWWNRRNNPEIDLVGADREPVARKVQFVGSVKWLETRSEEHTSELQSR